ncbi:MAG: RNA polymerase II mediator complex subunit [Watsoniomyces obsoletus]|nr:MAG: RNA polymerase II mediator complex subunit [Watsoniomyces obsoletus]
MATDILTQLQTCYDQLLTQFFSTVSYLSLRHPLIAPEPIPGEPYTQPPRDDDVQNAATSGPSTSRRHRYANIEPRDEDTSLGFKPVPPTEFDNAQQELADDLVRKGQQIEHLIRNLPGLGRGEAEQAQEIQELVVKVREMQALRRQKRKEMRECVRRLDNVVSGMATSINTGNADALPFRNGTRNGG